MIKLLLKIGVLLVIAVIGYNYFLGDAEEKENSTKIINEVKDLGKSVGGVIKSETEKFKEGKLDQVLAEMSALMGNLESKAQNDPSLRKKLEDLRNEKENLEDRIDKIQAEDNTERGDRKALKKEIEKLEQKFEALMKEEGIQLPEQ